MWRATHTQRISNPRRIKLPSSLIEKMRHPTHSPRPHIAKYKAERQHMCTPWHVHRRYQPVSQHVKSIFHRHPWPHSTYIHTRYLHTPTHQILKINFSIDFVSNFTCKIKSEHQGSRHELKMKKKMCAREEVVWKLVKKTERIHMWSCHSHTYRLSICKLTTRMQMFYYVYLCDPENWKSGLPWQDEKGNWLYTDDFEENCTSHLPYE